METKREKNTLKSSPQKLLARFLWNFIRNISVIWGVKAYRNIDCIIILVTMATKRKNPK